MDENAKPATTPTGPAGAPAGVGQGAGAGRGRPGRGRVQPPQPGADGLVGKGQGAVRMHVDGMSASSFQSGECSEGSEEMC